MKIEDLREGLYVADGRTLLKVSTVYANYATLQVVYPLPPRTTVRSYGAEAIEGFKTPTKAMVDKAHAAYEMRNR